MLFWHGGNIDNNKPMKFKSGRYEYGPGLYATTHYETAKKYSKGSRKLYLLDIQKGKDLRDSLLPIQDINNFVKSNATKAKRKEILERLDSRNQNGQVPAYMFVNIILNEEALKPTKMTNLRQFLVDNGIDYELVSNPFGWHETMIVLYNMNKISQIKKITPKDTIKEYDLSKVSDSESMQSIIASCRARKIARILSISECLKTTNKIKIAKKMIVYHGTDSKFKKFDRDRSTQGLIWFTSDKNEILKEEVGAQGKGYIITAEVTIDNPAGWAEYDKMGLFELEREFDGAILPNKNDNEFYCFIFDPKQAKILNIEKVED